MVHIPSWLIGATFISGAISIIVAFILMGMAGYQPGDALSPAGKRKDKFFSQGVSLLILGILIIFAALVIPKT